MKRASKQVSRRASEEGVALVLLLAFGLASLLMVVIFVLGVISLMELSMSNVAWRLFAAAGIGSFVALIAATKLYQFPPAREDEAHD